MLEDNDLMFAEDLRPYEDKWIALIETDGMRRIVGSGQDAEDAMSEARANGFADAYLYKVFPFDLTYAPSTFA